MHFINIYPFHLLFLYIFCLHQYKNNNFSLIVELFRSGVSQSLHLKCRPCLKYRHHAQNSSRCFQQWAKRGHWQYLKTDSTGIVYGQVCAVVWPHYSTLGYVTGFGLGEPLQWHCGFLGTHCLPAWPLCAFTFTKTLSVLQTNQNNNKNAVLVFSCTQKHFMVSLNSR